MIQYDAIQNWSLQEQLNYSFSLWLLGFNSGSSHRDSCNAAQGDERRETLQRLVLSSPMLPAEASSASKTSNFLQSYFKWKD